MFAVPDAENVRDEMHPGSFWVREQELGLPGTPEQVDLQQQQGYHRRSLRSIITSVLSSRRITSMTRRR